MVIHWSLSDSKSPQVSRTLLNILVLLNNAVVWMVSTSPLISKSSNQPILWGLYRAHQLQWYHRLFQLPLLIIIIIILLFANFSHQRELMVFLWSLSDSKSLQVSRALFTILADLSNPVVCICRSSHRPDKYGIKSFLGGSRRRAVAQTHPVAPKMPRASSGRW